YYQIAGYAPVASVPVPAAIAVTVTIPTCAADVAAGAQEPADDPQHPDDDDEEGELPPVHGQLSTSAIRIAWAPSQRVRRPISRRRYSTPTSGVIDAKWLAAS